MQRAFKNISRQFDTFYKSFVDNTVDKLTQLETKGKLMTPSGTIATSLKIVRVEDVLVSAYNSDWENKIMIVLPDEDEGVKRIFWNEDSWRNVKTEFTSGEGSTPSNQTTIELWGKYFTDSKYTGVCDLRDYRGLVDQNSGLIKCDPDRDTDYDMRFDWKNLEIDLSIDEPHKISRWDGDVNFWVVFEILKACPEAIQTLKDNISTWESDGTMSESEVDVHYSFLRALSNNADTNEMNELSKRSGLSDRLGVPINPLVYERIKPELDHDHRQKLKDEADTMGKLNKDNILGTHHKYNQAIVSAYPSYPFVPEKDQPDANATTVEGPKAYDLKECLETLFERFHIKIPLAPITSTLTFENDIFKKCVVRHPSVLTVYPYQTSTEFGKIDIPFHKEGRHKVLQDMLFDLETTTEQGKRLVSVQKFAYMPRYLLIYVDRWQRDDAVPISADIGKRKDMRINRKGIRIPPTLVFSDKVKELINKTEASSYDDHLWNLFLNTTSKIYKEAVFYDLDLLVSLESDSDYIVYRRDRTANKWTSQLSGATNTQTTISDDQIPRGSDDFPTTQNTVMMLYRVRSHDKKAPTSDPLPTDTYLAYRLNKIPKPEQTDLSTGSVASTAFVMLPNQPSLTPNMPLSSS